jgi:hypothetical protein
MTIRHHLELTHGTLPVKLMPAKYLEAVMVSPKTGPSAGTKLTTPGGTPASRHTLKMSQFERRAVSLGFHNTALPCSAQPTLATFTASVTTYHEGRSVGEVAADRGEIKRRHCRYEAVDAPVPHRVLGDLRVFGDRLVLGGLLQEVGVQPVTRQRLQQEKARPGLGARLKKSMSSAAESISAWITVLAWPSMVAAFSVCLYSLAMREAAFSHIFRRSGIGVRSHFFWAATAVSIALFSRSLSA